MEETEILKIFKDTNAFLEGHFELSSGLHSKYYMQCAQVLQYPKLAEKLCTELAGRFAGVNIETVVSPAIGGIVVGQELARALNARAIFCERENGEMKLRRGFNLNEGENVLIVEDVITTGKSTNEVIEAVTKAKVNIVGVACLVNRGNKTLKLNLRKEALLNINIETYDPSNCLLCKKGIPFQKPGSRMISK